MGIEEIIDVQISIQDQAVERAGFGIGLIVGPSNKLTSKVQTFSNATAVSDVFASGDPELDMANAYFGQDLKPTSVIIANRDADVKQKDKIIIAALQNTTDYDITVQVINEDGDPTSGVLTFTSDGDATRAEIVDGLVAAINASSIASLVTLTDNGDDFDIESNTAGDPLVITVSANLSVQAVTANVNLTTELAAIEQLNNSWYGLMVSSHSLKDIRRASAFIQARRKIYGTSSQLADIVDPEKHVLTLDFDADFVTGNTIDLDIDGIPVAQTAFNTDQATTLNDLATNIQAHVKVATATTTGARQITITSEGFDALLVVDNIVVAGGASQANGSVTTTQDPTTDIGSELKADSLDRTFLTYLSEADSDYPECAWIGGRFPEDPGSQTWAFKTLSGVTVDSLTDSQKTKALGNNVNVYTTIGGVNLTQNGTMASGRFIDIRRGVDWMQARIEEQIFSRIANLKKIPYTDAGVAIIEDQIQFVLDEAIANGVVREGTDSISVPKVADVSVNDRAARLLPDVTFEAEMAGAVHKVIVRGTVSV